MEIVWSSCGLGTVWLWFSCDCVVVVLWLCCGWGFYFWGKCGIIYGKSSLGSVSNCFTAPVFGLRSKVNFRSCPHLGR